MQPKTYLIDGYNVIRNTPGLAAAERLGLAQGRERLVGLVAAKLRHTPHVTVIVFDGDGECETTTSLAKGVRGRIVFSRRGEPADAVIQRLAAQERACGCEVVAISDDLEVRLGIAAAGGTAARVGEFARHLDAPARHIQKQTQHRQYVRRELAGEREGTNDRTRGNPKRTPKRRREPPQSPFF